MDFAAFGSCAFDSNVIQIVSSPQHRSGESTPKVVKRWKTSGPVHALSWGQSKMLVSSSNRKVYLYNVDISSLESGESRMEVDPLTYFDHHLEQDVYIPGVVSEHEPIDHAGCVVLDPLAEQQFLSVKGTDFFVWDISRPAAPTYASRGSRLPLTTATYNPHNPTQITFAGTTRTIKVIDCRMLSAHPTKAVVWRKSAAHNSSIQHIQWSPLVPHWIASASSDGSVKVWDLRYDTEAAIEINGHSHAVSEIQWSPVHAEMLLSCGLDGMLKWWNMHLEPHYEAAMSHDHFDEPLVGCCFFPNNWKGVCALGSEGTFETIHMADTFYHPFVNSRFSSKDRGLRELERTVYMRDLVQAAPEIVKWTRTLYESKRLEEALTVAQMANLVEENLGMLDIDMKEAFRDDLTKFSYFLPPGFKFRPNEAKSVEIVLNLKKSVQLLQKLCEPSSNYTMVDEEQLIRAVKDDHQFFNAAVMRGFIQQLFDTDYERTLKIGMKLVDLHLQLGEQESAMSVSYELLRPTIFSKNLIDIGRFGSEGFASQQSGDEDERKSFEKMFSQADPRMAIQMLINMMDVLPDPLSAKRILKLVGRLPLDVFLTQTMSFLPVHLFMESLLIQDSYGLFFLSLRRINEIEMLRSSFLGRYARENLLPDGEMKFAKFLGLVQHESGRMSLATSMHCTFVIVHVLCASSSLLSSPISSSLPSIFKDLKWSLQNRLDDIRRPGTSDVDMGLIASKYRKKIASIPHLEPDASSYWSEIDLMLSRFLEKKGR
eukprot:TRINITY_DN3467_c0_g1_i4.p1 TRINITY_DN3467_c0_g1~~TRINITY_DN3467_c0_g1_i4.p1  ORF type:complete len:768 (+),score=170.72 TRINITY_DN3467_c0_g1_i4:292-2595(+)